MKINKLLGLGLGIVLGGIALTSCNIEDESKEKETVVINALNAEKIESEITVPYNPERIAILDMASLDIIDALGEGARVVGSADVTLDYLEEEYSTELNTNIINLGNVKTASMENLYKCEPDIIFIGGRLAAQYAEFEEIAPVVYLAATAGQLYEDTIKNVTEIAKIFGKENEVEETIAQYNIESRIDTLKTAYEGKTALNVMFNGSTPSILASSGRLSLIVNEIGFNNLGDSDVDSAHGEEASFELFVALNPEYIFVMNRNAIAGTGIEASPETIIGGNQLVQATDAYKNNRIIYLAHPDVWYLADGGIQALDTCLKDLEIALGL